MPAYARRSTRYFSPGNQEHVKSSQSEAKNRYKRTDDTANFTGQFFARFYAS
jgi:hypothetical protein